MKRLMFLLFLITCWSGIVLGQRSLSTSEVVYGTVETDGYQNVTKGAMWSVRPIARAIYEGAHPQGYTVFILEKEYFVRFVDGESNSRDDNYIVFPKGALVYSEDTVTDDKTSKFYSALCGNRIAFIRPVDMVRVVEKTVFVKDSTPPTQTSSMILSSYNNISTNTNTNYNYYEMAPLQTSFEKPKKNWIPTLVVAGVTVSFVGVVYLVRSLFFKENHPGGARITPPETPPVTPVDPGGPGGSPTTK